ncbi:MAG: polymorphic toxin-type HINT domain-containing protein [Pirellulaceae bacterium]|nr:polymorphic toxin-type HINT domain-containing protein [Pirellulaceae bacterium]
MKCVHVLFRLAITISLMAGVLVLGIRTGDAQVGTLPKYLAMRHQMVDDRDGHQAMSRWARELGLPEQSRAHLLRLLDFDPENQQVRRELGHVNVDGRWLTKEEFDEMTAEKNRRTQLYRQWAEPVGKAVKQMTSPRKSNQQRGHEMLAAISDPGATYAVEQFLCSQPMPNANVGIQKIHSFEGEDATGALLRVSVFHRDPSARQAAAQLLAEREADEFIPDLVGMLESPVTSRFIVTRVGFGQLLHRHVFVQQRFDQDVVRQYDQLYLANLPTDPRIEPSVDSINRALVDNVQTSQWQTQQVERAKAAQNSLVTQRNARVIDVLRQVAGEDAGSSAEDWWKWWYDQNDVSYYQRPTSYKAEYVGATVTTGVPAQSCECFVAGTVVWTERGLLPIETLRTGDRVLARDLKSNQLVYRNVINSTTRERTPTLLVRLPNETLQVSGGHPFHVDGQGWVRARDLKRGIALTGQHGVVMVEDISNGSIEPLFNLVVERDSNYFVGTEGVLSHDHTIPSTPVVVPKR